MPKVGDVRLMDESFDRFLTMAEQGATTVYSVAGVTFRMDALRSITADGAQDGAQAERRGAREAHDGHRQGARRARARADRTPAAAAAAKAEAAAPACVGSAASGRPSARGVVPPASSQGQVRE